MDRAQKGASVALVSEDEDDGGSDGDYDPQTLPTPPAAGASADSDVDLSRTEFAEAQPTRLIAPMDSAAYDKLDIMHTAPCEIPPFARGKLMNRYFDILPNPATQVQLQQQGADPATTYINANFIRSFGGRRATEYIAAQGPLPATVEAFMRMLWEQKLVVLVQTTGFVEEGTVKCEQYLPEDVGKLNVGPSGQWTVDCKRVDRQAGYNISELIIHNNRTREQREVAHFWFNTWRVKTHHALQ